MARPRGRLSPSSHSSNLKGPQDQPHNCKFPHNHFALYGLIEAVEKSGAEDSKELLDVLIKGKRLKDISDFVSFPIIIPFGESLTQMSEHTPAQIRIKEVLLVISKCFSVMEQIATHQTSS